MPNPDDKKPKKGLLSKLFTSEEPPKTKGPAQPKKITLAERVKKLPKNTTYVKKLFSWNVAEGVGNLEKCGGISLLVRSESLGQKKGDDFTNRRVEFNTNDIQRVEYQGKERYGLKKANLLSVERW